MQYQLITQREWRHGFGCDLGSLLIQTPNGEDILRLGSLQIRTQLDVRTGRHSDIVDINDVDALTTRVLLYRGHDFVTFTNSDLGISSFIDGGLGFDTANDSNSSYGKSLVIGVENGNL